MNHENNHIDYVEFMAHDLELIKKFYTQAFSWKFTDYGENYIAFNKSGLQGGFEKTNEPIVNGALIVLYHQDLEDLKRTIQLAGGKIVQDIFTFPGGKRFHFKDPSGNELAVWCED